MTRSNLLRIILTVGSVLIIVGVALTGWVLATEDERGAIEVKLKRGETKTLTFEDLALVPGEEHEYIVQMKKVITSQYHLELDFVEIEETELKYYARVKILSNDEVICDELLADAFEKEKMVLAVDFDKGENTELKIVYYLPIDVGNEAKKAEAVFELLLTASNE